MKRDAIREGGGGLLMIRTLKGSSFLNLEISQKSHCAHKVLHSSFIRCQDLAEVPHRAKEVRNTGGLVRGDETR